MAFDFTFWHDNGAYLPYGIIVMINTATQVLGPYKPKSFRVNAYSLYTNTVIVTRTAAPDVRRPCSRWERSMDAIAKYLNKTRSRCGRRTSFAPRDMPYDFGLMFQDGRPLIYDTGDYQAGIDKLKKLIDWDGFPEYQRKARAEGRSVGIGIGAYVEGTGPGPYEGAHVVVETSGKVKAATA